MCRQSEEGVAVSSLQTSQSVSQSDTAAAAARQDIIIITCYTAIETLPGHRQRLEAERTELTLLTVRQGVTVCRELSVTADGSWLVAARGPTPTPPTHQVRKEGWTSVTCRNNCDNMLGY